MRNTPSAITRAIADLPTALAAQHHPGDEAAATTVGIEQAPPSKADQSESSPARWGGLVEQLGGRGDAANDPASAGDGDTDSAFSFVQERRLVRGVIAERFVIARELNGWSQTEAAHALGFAKSGQLSLVEAGKKVPPLDLIARASEVFCVSTDFLFGQSDEEDRDPKLARRAALRAFIGAAVDGLADTLADTGEKLIEAQAVDVEPLATTAGRVIEAFARYARQAGFEDVRGGATLAAAVGALDEALGPVMKGLRRHAALDTELRQRIAEARRGSASTENGASVRATVTRT